MPKKTGTIHIKWVRSGIGFSRKQKEVVRSIGLRRLNQVVERPDSVHFRGLVAKVSHLVEVVSPTEAPVWAGIPEYKIIPAESAPVKVTPTAKAKTTKAATEAPAEVPAVAKETASKEKEPQKEKEKVAAPAKKPVAKRRATKSTETKAAAEPEKSAAKRKPAAPRSEASDKKDSKSKKGKK